MFAPMSLGELLDGAFGLYRRHFALLVGIAAVTYGPYQAMSIYLETAGGWAQHFGLAIVMVSLMFLGGLIGSAAILKVVSDGYLEREGTIQDALAFAYGKSVGLLIAGLASGILTVLGLALFVVPGIIIACGYSVVSQVVVLEDLPTSTDALGRSWALTKGYKWTAFALWLVLALVAVMLPAVLTGILAGVGLKLPAEVVGSILGVLLSPLVPCGMTLFYYDLRVRKEAFDLEVLGQLMGGTGA